MKQASPLESEDHEIFELTRKELSRQRESLSMIASENFTSPAVMEAQGCVLTNKYAEGYPGFRYYGGCNFVDEVEKMTINRAKMLFRCSFANVQPHSGTQANQAVFMSLLRPGDPILGMSLSCGGHLTHGSKVSMAGKWFKSNSYEVRREDELIDMEQVARLARLCRPKLIIAGCSAYPRFIDFEAFRNLADEVNAYLLVDMAHYAGLVAGEVFPTPLTRAHLVTSTTHKTLRGPRGGLILSQNEDLGARVNAAVFPGVQGGPLMHVIAAKAVALKEAMGPDFRKYAVQVVANCKALQESFVERGLHLVTGGTDCHFLLVKLSTFQVDGDYACKALEKANIIVNKNIIPFDPLMDLKMVSGLRFGSPALTSRGLVEDSFKTIGHLIVDVLESLTSRLEDQVIKKVRTEVMKITNQYPLYPEV